MSHTGPRSGVPFAGRRRNVSPLELFFDLVFVFAVGQLAHHLHTELSWRGAAETAVMLIAVLSTWALTSFDATFLDVERSRTPSRAGRGPSWFRWWRSCCWWTSRPRRGPRPGSCGSTTAA